MRATLTGCGSACSPPQSPAAESLSASSCPGDPAVSPITGRLIPMAGSGVYRDHNSLETVGSTSPPMSPRTRSPAGSTPSTPYAGSRVNVLLRLNWGRCSCSAVAGRAPEDGLPPGRAGEVRGGRAGVMPSPPTPTPATHRPLAPVCPRQAPQPLTAH
jgi:hypothetical protein